jgi:hypothetical protein
MKLNRLGLAVFLAAGVGCGAQEEETNGSEDSFTEQAIACDNPGSRSFASVRDAVARPSPTNVIHARGRMPKRGRPHSSFVDALTGGFSHDASQILQCTRDFRENANQGDKIIHAPGVCATATWEMNGVSGGVNRNAENQRMPYTGLFAPTTKVNAIVRISSGTNISDPTGKVLLPSWGLGIKLFPAPASRPDQPASSVQIVMFDQSGVAGSASREMLRSDNPSEPHFFTNWLYGSDLFALASLTIFNRFVTPHTHLGTPLAKQARLQAIDEAARVTGAGVPVPIENAHYPTILKVQLAEGVPTLDEIAARNPGVDLGGDFRDQLVSYTDGELVFDIIGDNDALGPEPLKRVGSEQRIGSLRLGAPVVSDVCDKELTFKHRRQGEVFSGWRPGDR